jgi:hypothetical protein
MTAFEQYLIENGWLKFTLNCKTMRYEKAIGHELSTMTNLNHRYFHESDTNILDKIERGLSVKNGGITWKDRKNEIIFGLHEKDMPATLISPRPIILVKRIRNGEIVIENETLDNSMNVVLEKIENSWILRAMFQKITLAVDLTDANY